MLLLPLLAVRPQEAFEKAGAFPDPLRDAALRMASGADVLHYDLDFRLAMTAEALEGKVDIQVRLLAPADSVVLNALRLRIDSVRVNGVPCTFTADTSRETLAILLPGPRPPGDTLRISVHYARPPSSRSRRGYFHFRDLPGLPAPVGYTFSEPSDARLWFPCVDDPADKATMEMRLRVPEGFTAASNGRLVGVTANGDGTMTWRWRETHPIATYLMCITASDFAFSQCAFVRAPGDTVPLQYYTWRADSAQAAAYLPAVDTMMRTFSTYFGPYPFDKYGMTGVAPFGYLGMEHQSLSTLSRYALTWRRVVAHELVHQWWGDLVTPGDWRDIWLNESFATYGEALLEEATRGGPEALRRYMVDTLEEFQYASWQGSVYDPVGQGFNLFDRVVYSKGAWVLHTLRHAIGDSAWWHVLGAYRARFGYGNASTAGFKSVADSVTGRDISWFFSSWVYGRGWPQFRVLWEHRNGVLSVTLNQVQPGSWSTFTAPITIRVRRVGEPDVDHRVWDSLRTQNFTFAVAGQVTGVELDPDRHVLRQVVGTSSADEPGDVPAEFALHQNFPNPFNPGTVVRFTLPLRAEARLEVIDLLGRVVGRLHDGIAERGFTEVRWEAGGLPSGVYFVRLRSGGRTATVKAVLAR
jgi:aminopeptidase N